MNELQVFKNVELGSVRTTVVDGIPFLWVRMWLRFLVIVIHLML